jgi:glyoxylase-like metal-dependent hydrolase (beta-lactamase superfamily II)
MVERSDGQQIVPGVFLVGGPELTDPADCLVYAVDGGTEVALIDCGAGASVPGILANVRAAGLGDSPLTTLILTHCHVDHVGGLAALAAAAAPRVVCHRGDVEAVESGDPERTAASWYGVRLPPARVDQVLEGDEATVAVGAAALRCLHTPGHTPGSIAVVWDTPHGRVLFAQDVHGPFSPAFGSDEDRWAESMHRLLALEADVLCEGHYGIFRPQEAAAAFLREQLERQGYD